VGITQPAPNVTEWDVTRPASDVLPELLTLEALPATEALTISIRVTDAATGQSAVTSRVVTVRRP
jgi:hypothetical protein